MNKPITVAYFFTRFPVRTETFLQREVRSMRSLGIKVRLYALFGGQAEFEGLPVRVLHLGWLPWLLCRTLPSALWREPRSLHRLMSGLWDTEVTSILSVWENLWGWGCALLLEREIRRENPDWLHAVWSSMPASCAQLLAARLGKQWSFGAHAYDVFEHGGDWMLARKAGEAAFVHTSTRSSAQGLRERGVPATKIVLIRRGLESVPARQPVRPGRLPLRILNVGRVVPKKGHRYFLSILAAAAHHGLAFSARVVGGGALLEDLRRETRRLGLERSVDWLGALEPDEVGPHYAWADVLLFTGMVVPNGDRDGLPNVIPEAMGRGIPVLSSPVGGVPEAIENGTNGFLLNLEDQTGWVRLLRQLARDDALCQRIGDRAHEWVREHFHARDNARMLARNWLHHIGKTTLQPDEHPIAEKHQEKTDAV